MSLLIDTSVWFAASNRRDRYNDRAKAILATADARTTTDFVMVETWLLLHRRVHYEAAERFLRAMGRGIVSVERVQPSDIDVAGRIGERYRDQEFSLVDRTSFAVMERLRLNRVASFGDDFAIYRFGPGRAQAFDVLK